MQMKIFSIWIILLLTAGCVLAVPAGLYVENKTLMHSGKPYRGMGVNYYSCFNTLFAHPENRDFVEGFRILREDYDIPFIRFAACSYGSKSWKLYENDPAEYYRRFDLIVKEAEKQHLGLIPSLFWRLGSVGDWCDESLGQLGNPGSRTRAFYRKYAEETARRYKDSPALWGWEVGNEYMLGADLPKLNHLPPPKAGSNEPRTAADKIFRPMILDLYEDVYRTIRAVDPDRIILTGDSMTRDAAWHNHYNNAWGLDTRDQWLEIFSADTPDCFDVVSIHLYPEMEKHYFAGEKVTIEEFTAAAVRSIRKRGRPVWCGEFGAAASDEGEQEMVLRMVQIIRDEKIELSALWNFVPAGTFQKGVDVNANNHRSWMLSEIKKFNRQAGEGR